MKRYLPGMFTIEAAILMPFLFVVTITAISYIAYICDRSMLIQDANAVCADLRAGSAETDLKEHPYLLIKDLSIHVEKENGKLQVTTSGEWYSPLWYGLKIGIQQEQTAYTTTPQKVMRVTMDIMEKAKKTEENNDTDKQSP